MEPRTQTPYEQSVMMADELKKHGVKHELIGLEGGEHGLAGADRKEIQAAYRRAIEFNVDWKNKRINAGATPTLARACLPNAA